ncbi:MAG: DUF4350 domain-containing protein [Myxococcota bacterium]
MSDRRVVALLLLVVAGLAAGFFTLFERYEEEIDRGASDEARRNRFLAAELFLRRVHRGPVESHSSWASLGDFDGRGASGALIIADSRLVLSDSQADRLLDWARSGGHLIVGAAPVFGDAEEPPRLFARLGLSHGLAIRAKCQGDEHGDSKAGATQSDCEPSSHEQSAGAGDEDAAEHEREDEDQEGKAGAEARGREEKRSGGSDERPISERLRDHNEEILEARRAREARATEGAEASSGENAKGEGKPGEKAEPIPPEEITRLHFEGETSTLELHFSGRTTLHHAAFMVDDPPDGEENVADDAAAEGEDPAGSDPPAPETPTPSAWSSSDVGVHLVQFHLDEGLVTILSDASIWETGKIAELDHAHLLRGLCDGSEEVALLYGREVASVATWIGRNARAPLLAGLLVLVAWLWHRGRRFGPVLPDPADGSRSLVEQIDGTARYLWWNGHGEVLVEAMRDEVERIASRRLPGFMRLSPDERIDWLAGRGGLSKRAVREAFVAGVSADEQGFIHLARRLREIRNTR